MNSPATLSEKNIWNQVKRLTWRVIKNPVLSTLQSWKWTIEQWREFAKQRYLAAHLFVPLLEMWKMLADASWLDDIAQSLVANLHDEKGIREWKIVPELSHETWRVDFYKALWVDEDSLENAEPNVWSKNYQWALEKLIKERNLHRILWAVLFLEWSIPPEFLSIKKWRDSTFPDIFVYSKSDTPEQIEYKRRARIYIDDHITHDAQSHYPDLLRAVLRSVRDNQGVADIFEWMEIVAKVRGDFYREMEKEFRL